MPQPNVLFIMTDQQRYDTIHALGNSDISTPNLDRLVARGVAFTNAYSTCPVCAPARYTIRTGMNPPRTGIFSNWVPDHMRGRVEQECGPYLARTMSRLGYRTFGVGKFHAVPWDEDLGYEVLLHAEAQYESAKQRTGDDYAQFLSKEHGQFAHIEVPTGERSDMYYMPQASPYPAELTSEAWVTDRVVDLLRSPDSRPSFGLVSYFSPHPPIAPPVPYNRAYDPDRLADPIVGDLATDHADEQIPWMNHAVYAEEVDAVRARTLKARYYGAISHVDRCIGRILDAVEARPDADNTVICFFADHGDHLGDHHAWQKESYFEASCRIPMLVSWPQRLPAGTRSDALAELADLFGVATGAAGHFEARDGIDLLRVATGETTGREALVGYYGEPGTPRFKVMIRRGPWKYIFLSNGARELLFNLADDAHELINQAPRRPDIVAELYSRAVSAAHKDDLVGALNGSDLRTFAYQERKRARILQFDRSRGVTGFPDDPRDVID